MKRIIKTLFLIIFVPLLVNGQTDSADLLSVSATKMNVLYIWRGNPIDIAVCNVHPDSITATIDSGELVRVSGVHWIAKVRWLGSMKLKVFVINDGKKELYDVREYRVVREPNVVLFIADAKLGDVIEKQRIIENPYLKAVIPGYLFEDELYEFVSFKFSVVIRKKIFEVNCIGNQLSPEAILLIKKLKPGMRMFFEDVKAKDSNGNIRHLPSAILKVK